MLSPGLIEPIARYLVKRRGLRKDPSVDLLLNLAMAFAAMEAMEQKYNQDYSILKHHIVKAFIEGLTIRSHLPVDSIDDITITRFGRLNIED